MLKKVLSVAVLTMFFAFSVLSAHPGKLRKDGGHCDNKKKEYHFHKKGKVTGASKALYSKLCKAKKAKKGKKLSRKEKKENITKKQN